MLQNSQKSKTEIGSALEKIAAQKAFDEGDVASQNLSSTLRLEINTLTQGIKNANEGIGFLQIAGGILQGLGGDADRLGALSVALNSGAVNSEQAQSMRSQADTIKAGMAQAVNNATYSGKSVFQESFEVMTSATNIINTIISRPDISGVDIDSGDSIEEFIKGLAQDIAKIGAAINQLGNSAEGNSNAIVNLTQSESNLQDSDVAENYNELNGAFLRENASLYANAFNTSTLASKLDSLLN